MRGIVVTSSLCALLASAPVVAQVSRDARSGRTVYGARLAPVGPNEDSSSVSKVDRRLDTRINSRISTRLERYRLADPATAFAIAQGQLAKRIAPIQPAARAGEDQGEP